MAYRVESTGSILIQRPWDIDEPSLGQSISN